MGEERDRLASIRERVERCQRSGTTFVGTDDVAWLLARLDTLRGAPGAGDFTDWGAVADQIEKMEKARDAFKGAFQILWNCHHGDKAICGCREHARALISAPASAVSAAPEGASRHNPACMTWAGGPCDCEAKR